MKQRKWKSIADKLHDEWCIENGYPIKIKQPRSRSKDESQRTDDTQEDGSGKDSDAQMRTIRDGCDQFLGASICTLLIYPILSHIRNVNCIQGVTQNKQVAVVVHKVKVSQTLYTGKNERIDMDRERDLTEGDTEILYLITLTVASAWSDES